MVASHIAKVLPSKATEAKTRGFIYVRSCCAWIELWHDSSKSNAFTSTCGNHLVFSILEGLAHLLLCQLSIPTHTRQCQALGHQSWPDATKFQRFKVRTDQLSYSKLAPSLGRTLYVAVAVGGASQIGFKQPNMGVAARGHK